MIIRIVTIFTLVFLLVACSTLSTEETRYPVVEIDVQGQDRIRFEGKGSGAGMMLMSAMGPAGIAIGVAIDEGIGKEIHETFSMKYRFLDIVIDETHRWLKTVCVDEKRPSLCDLNTLNISITHYGFKTTVGDDDPVMAKINVSIDGRDYQVVSDEEKPLALLKQEAKESAELLRTGYRSILAQLPANL